MNVAWAATEGPLYSKKPHETVGATPRAYSLACDRRRTHTVWNRVESDGSDRVMIARLPVRERFFVGATGPVRCTLTDGSRRNLHDRPAASARSGSLDFERMELAARAARATPHSLGRGVLALLFQGAELIMVPDHAEGQRTDS